MRVIHTVAGLDPDSGGPSRTVPALCAALGQAGVDVTLISQSFKGEGIAELPASDNVRTILVPGVRSKRLRLAFSLGFSPTLRSACGSGGVSVIHDHGMWLPSNIHAARVATALGLALVVSPRGTVDDWALGHRAWKKSLAWVAYQRRILYGARAFCATSDMEAAQLRKLGFRQPIAVIPNGIELPPERSQPQPRPSRSALFLSRIHPKKGLLDLIDAWAAVRPAGWTLRIAGPDEEGHQKVVARRIAERGLADCVSFLGPIEDRQKWEVYASADLFVLPTYAENFGVVVAEALAAGLPAITTRAAPWAALSENRCGWWIDPGAATLAAALKEATALTPGELHAMGKRGRELVGRSFSWPAIARSTAQFYRWLVAPQRSQAPAFVDAA